MDCDVSWLARLARKVEDFPKAGISFVDLGPLLANADGLRCSVELLTNQIVGNDVDYIAGIDARGFIVAAPVACRLGAGFIPVRKAGKLPGELHQIHYDLEYGSDTFEIQTDACGPGDRVTILDDILATGGSAKAAIELVEATGAEVVSVGFLATIAGLDGLKTLDGYKVFSVLGEL